MTINIGGPDMDDVPIGEPQKGYRPGSIGQGLLDIAAWFDIYDDRNGYDGERQVQADLRAWAARTMDMPADDIGNTEGFVNREDFCRNCRMQKLSNWYKCCPTHTTQNGNDVVCEDCYLLLHPETQEKCPGCSTDELNEHFLDCEWNPMNQVDGNVYLPKEDI